MNDTREATDRVDASRRAILKLTAAGLLVGAAGGLFPALSSAQAATTGAGKNALIVYYSRSGNTRALAKLIHGSMGGDIVEIQTVTPYPSEYKETTVQAKKELESGFKPPITTKVQNIAEYDVVFLGSPNWWGTIATPVMTFLSEHELSGKLIAPFITHGGSALGRSAEDIKRLSPKSTILQGLAVSGISAGNAQRDVTDWLRKTGMKA